MITLCWYRTKLETRSGPARSALLFPIPLSRKMLMNKNRFAIVFAALVFALALAPPASAGTQEQLIQIQTQLQLVQDNMARMQQSFDERMGVMKDMVTQQTDNVNKMGTAVQELQKTLSSQTSDASSKVDQISGQVQALHDAVDELKVRMAKVTKQLEDMQAAQQNMGTPPAGAPATGNVAPVPPRSNK